MPAIVAYIIVAIAAIAITYKTGQHQIYGAAQFFV